MDTTLTSRSTNGYNRFFDRPVYLSVVFLCVSGLFVIAEVRMVWILARYWHAIPQEMRLTSIILAAVIPLPWLMLIRQHRTLKFDGEPSQPQKLTTRGAVALAILFLTTLNYFLLLLSLELTFHLLRRL
jgi:hypothetical protein